VILNGFLLDTCTISALRYQKHSLHQTAQKWRNSCPEESLHISAVTIAELATGIHLAQMASSGGFQGEPEKEIQRFVSNCEVIGVDQGTSKIYGRVRAELFQRHGPKDSRGKIKNRWVEDLRDFTVSKPLGIQDSDLWIVCTAVQYNLVFVTLDLGGGMRNIVAAARYNKSTLFLQA